MPPSHCNAALLEVMHLYDKKIVKIFHVVGNLLAFTKYVKKLLEELICSRLFLIKADIQIG